MTPQRPGVRRRVRGHPRRAADPDAYVATFGPDGVELRPLRVRDPEAVVFASWSQVYEWALRARVRHG